MKPIHRLFLIFILVPSANLYGQGDPFLIVVDPVGDGQSCTAGTPLDGMDIPVGMDIARVELSNSEEGDLIVRMTFVGAHEGPQALAGGFEILDPSRPLAEFNPQWFFDNVGNISFNVIWVEGAMGFSKAVVNPDTRMWELDPNSEFTADMEADNVITITIPRSELPDGMGVDPTERARGMATATDFEVCDGAGANEDDGTPSMPLEPPEADLEIVKTGPVQAYPGQTIRYEVKVKNNGPDNGSGIIEDLLPQGITFIAFNPQKPFESSSFQCLPNGPGGAVWCAFALPAGDSVEVLIVGKLDPDTPPGSLSNTAEITDAPVPDPDSTNNSSTITTEIKDIVTKLADPNTVFHRVFVIGPRPNGVLNPFESYNAFDDVAELMEDLSGPENQAPGSTSMTLIEPLTKRLEEVMDSLKQVVEPGEEVTFVFSGHGWHGVDKDTGRIYDANHDEPSTGDETVWLNEHESLYDDDFEAKFITGFKPGVTFVAFFGSCYGGNMADGDTDIQESRSVSVIGVSTTCPQDGWGFFDYLNPSGITGAFVETLMEDLADGAGDLEADGDGDGIVTADEAKAHLAAEGWAIVNPPDGNVAPQPNFAKAEPPEQPLSIKSQCGAPEIGGRCMWLPRSTLAYMPAREENGGKSSTGVQLSVQGLNFAPVAAVDADLIYVDGSSTDTLSLGSAVTDESGAFELSVIIPEDVPVDMPLFVEMHDSENNYDWWVLHLAPISVNSTGDGADSDVQDLVCDDGAGNCTLRAAIEQANAFAGVTTIDLSAVSGSSSGKSSVATLRPTAPYPAITDPVILLGNSALEIDGSVASAESDGLTIMAGNSIVDGLIINRFGRDGIVLTRGNGTVIRNSVIGTNLDGVEGLGNGAAGIRIDSSDTNLIGGMQSGNTVAHNAGAGVVVTAGTGNSILSNAIYSNGGSGIDLGDDGQTPNDDQDADDGANRLMNYPIIRGVRLDDGEVAVDYSVSSTSTNASFPLTVEFFVADSDGDEGRTFLGSDTYENEGEEKTARFVPAGPVNDGDRMTATATDWHGNTSEFMVDQVKRVDTEDDAGPPIDFTLYESYPNPFSSYTTIGFDVAKTGAVSLEVYDMLGRRVRSLVEGTYRAGRWSARLDAHALPSGLYVVRLTATGRTWVNTVVVAK